MPTFAFRMRLPFHIIQLLKEKSGNALRIPSDCEYLSLDIESKTGVRIGATTLKRLVGFAQDEREPHTSTLDAIARYLGYAHWEELSQIEDKGNSDFSSSDEEIRSADLQPDAQVEIAYLPDRRLKLQYLGNQRYCVVESKNSKLWVGDFIGAECLAQWRVVGSIYCRPCFRSFVCQNRMIYGCFAVLR